MWSEAIICAATAIAPDSIHLSWRTTPLSAADLERLGAATPVRRQTGDDACTPALPLCLPALTPRLNAYANAVAWMRAGQGFIGMGKVMELRANGAQRISQLRRAWRNIVYASWWVDPLVRPGTGPLACASITFADKSAYSSALIIPAALIGVDQHGAWVTTCVPQGQSHPHPSEIISCLLQTPAEPDLLAAGGASVETGANTRQQYLEILARVTARLRRGEAQKVVLARDVLVRSAHNLRLGTLLSRLAHAYPSCWTFAVDDLVGASPEMLVRLRDRRLFSRVLAGTARKNLHSGARETEKTASWLENSEKNNAEHALARASALQALAPLCSSLQAPPRRVLELPNVLHLASDITGVVAGDTGALSLVQALHPTAAVGGTPTAPALEIIAAEEGMDRGRYAGPVGWVDWHGEGEWCIALRSGQLTRPQGADKSQQIPLYAGADAPVRVFGGGGIMPNSDPHDELAETEAKMRPLLTALGAQ